MSRPPTRQLPLSLDLPTRWAEWSFIEAASNADALALLRRPEAWPDGRLLLWGAPGTGKSHLLHRWAALHGTAPVAGPALHFPVVGDGPLVVDDADLAEEAALLHALNDRAERGRPCLLAAPVAPARWPVALPDLASRLRAMLACELATPDEPLLRTLLARLLAERQMAVPEAIQVWLLARLPREAGALREAAARLDRAALAAGGPVTRALAAAVVDEVELLWQPKLS